MTPQAKPYSDFYYFWQGSIDLARQEEIKQMTRKVSQVPTDQGGPDSAVITKIEIGEDGGIRTYLEGFAEPVRILPDGQTVQATAIYKRLLPLLTKSLSQQNIFQKIITVLALKWNWKYILPEWLDFVLTMNPILLKEEHYSQPTKELRRVLAGRLPQGIVDALTMVIEFDSAYRYRFQDVIVLLDKTRLKGYFKTVKELQRLLSILQERDIQGEGIQGLKWNKLKQFIPLLLLSPAIRKGTIEVLKELNLDEVKMSKEDIYATNMHCVYKCRGLTQDERRLENKLKYQSV